MVKRGVMMLNKVGALAAVVVVTWAFAFIVGGEPKPLETQPAPDGSVEYLSAKANFKPFPGQPEPQFCWPTSCCKRKVIPLSEWDTYDTDTVCLFTWRCPFSGGQFFAVLERRRVEICCWRGLRCFGFCVRVDPTSKRCWEEWQYRSRRVFIGCGCYGPPEID